MDYNPWFFDLFAGKAKGKSNYFDRKWWVNGRSFSHANSEKPKTGI
jgi:hypothetical protein